MNFKPALLSSALAVTAIVGLAACTANDTTLGGAARQNYAAQIVNPDPEYDAEQTLAGEPAAAAVERYRTGKVKQPVGVRTTTKSGGGGGGPN
jgi:hypothetical protein